LFNKNFIGYKNKKFTNFVDSSIDKKYFEKIRDHLDTGDWKSVTNSNTIEHCKNNFKLITDKTSYLVMKENIFKRNLQI
jgi:hypothetical protein